ncbi:MAG: FtsX-like permease family protein [Candidatus Aminicenantes bacterium]|nr:FtsX-like permease family protein [Candidatus Aminicenantes bacterium]
MKVRTGILGEVVRMAVESLKAHKLRSFLTLLGIMIGVATVIGMVSIIQGLNRTFLAELESAGSNIIIVAKFEPGIRVGRLSEEERQRKDLTFEDARALERECPLVRAVAVSLPASFFESTDVRYRNIRVQDAVILGMNDRFPQVVSVYLPQRGRFLSGADIEHSTRVCVLGIEVAETLFPQANPLEKKIRIGAEEYTVVGVLEKRGSMFGQSRDNFVGIPITTLRKHFRTDPGNLEIIAVPTEPGRIFEAMEQIINLLRQRRKVGFGKPNDFAVFTQDTILGLYNQITGAAYLVMIIISSIGLLVGGIGVMNIMLVSAKERTREIGIRKALGARSKDILRQFLIEAVFLTFTGGLLGLLLGFGVALLVRAATPLPAAVTGWSVGLGLFVSAAVGLFFGIFPARRAARVDPIVSLRYE